MHAENHKNLALLRKSVEVPRHWFPVTIAICLCSAMGWWLVQSLRFRGGHARCRNLIDLTKCARHGRSQKAGGYDAIRPEGADEWTCAAAASASGFRTERATSWIAPTSSSG